MFSEAKFTFLITEQTVRFTDNLLSTHVDTQTNIKGEKRTAPAPDRLNVQRPST